MQVEGIPAQFARQIENIGEDNLSGAVDLTRDCAKLLMEVVEELKDSPNTELIHMLRRTCIELARSQPSMAPIFNLCNDLLIALDESFTNSEIVGTVTSFCTQTLEDLDSAVHKIAVEAADLIDESMVILTISKSSTVLAAIKEAYSLGRTFEVMCLEGRPMNEGAMMAEEIAEMGLDVRLVTDATAAAVVPRIDIVMVGGDTISSEGVVNKMGTMNLALACNFYKVRMYSLCQTSKVLPSTRVLRAQISREPDEVYTPTSKRVDVINLYFDITPLDMLTGVITERGIMDEDMVRELMQDKQVHELL